VTLFLDTSALVKLYVLETGSERVRDAIACAKTVAASRIAYAEARAALARAHRESRIRTADLRRALSELDEDWERFFIVEATSGVARNAGDLAEKHGLRAYDALQLASALLLQRDVKANVAFLAFDEDLMAAAADAGLDTP
jgi:predicted nucleic acid-binding protein